MKYALITYPAIIPYGPPWWMILEDVRVCVVTPGVGELVTEPYNQVTGRSVQASVTLSRVQEELHYDDRESHEIPSYAWTVYDSLDELVTANLGELI